MRYKADASGTLGAIIRRPAVLYRSVAKEALSLNAVIEYVNYERRARSNHLLDSAWFGQGAQLKARALVSALTVAG